MALIYLYESTETDFRYNGKPLPKAVVDVQWGLNDEFYAMGRYPIDEDEVYKEIVEDRIVKVHTFHGMEPMRIVDVQDRDLYVEFEAWPLFFADMRNKMVKPLNLRNTTGQVALNAFFNNLLIEPRFNFYSNITETHDYHTQDVEERENNPNQLYDALEVFSAIVRRWNGEISIRGYDIRMNNRVGTDTEALLYEKKNITEFLDGTNIKNIVTRAHGKAEWTEEGPDGEQIDRSIQATVDSPLINAYSGIIFERQYTNNDVRSEKELKDWLSLKFSTENLDKPTRSIEVNTNMINGTNVGPADTLILKYIKHDVDMRIKIVGYEYDGFANKLKRFILGEPKATVSNTIGNTITETINNVVRPIAQTAIRAQQSADGKRTKYSGTQDPNTLNLNANKGDEYWRDIGDETIIYEFNGTTWDIIIDTSETTKNAKAIAAQQQEIEEAKQTADDAVGQINTAVANAGFTSLDETISSVQTISNQAQINSGTAINNALEAMQQASQAIDNTGSLNIRVDEVEGTLSVKADKQMVDDLTGVVDSQALDIQANAQGLALKANQSTVDMLTGTVQSLGTNFDIVAGQVNSRVWNTDIETAIDGIEVGGRNLLLDSSGIAMNRSDHGNNNLSEVGSDGSVVIMPINQGNVYNLNVEPSMELVKGHEYTLSFDVLTNSPTGIYWYANASGSSYSGGRIPDTKGEWIKYEFTYTQTRDSFNGRFLFGFHNLITGSEIRYRNPKLEKGNKATDWTPAPEDTDAKISHIETEWTQTFDSFNQTVSDIDGRVTSQKQTIEGMQDIVYDPETGLSSLNTQLANLVQVAVTGPELSNALSVTETSILAQTVKNGEVVARINQEAGVTLIQNDKLYLDAETVAFSGQAFIPSAAIQELSADKVTTGTLNAAHVAITNLDASSISTGTLEGIAINGVTITGSTYIQENPTAGSTHGRWDRRGITLRDASGTMIMDMNREGINFHGSGVNHSGTYINNDLIDVQNATIYNLNVTGPTARMNAASFNGNLSVGSAPNNIDAGIIFNGQNPPAPYNRMIWAGFGSSGNGLYTYFNGWLRLQNEITNASNITMNSLTVNNLTLSSPLTLTNRLSLQNAGLQFSGGSLPGPVDRQMWIGWGYDNNGIYVSLGGNWYKHGATISDERLKNNIVETATDSLDAIGSWKFVEFEWKDSVFGSGQQFGLIAQNTSHIANYYDEVDRWEIDTQKLSMMTAHGLQQLSLREENTNQVASQALQATETNEEKIKRLEKRIEELESAA